METIFDLHPGDYVISDESELVDFTDVASSNTTEIWARIKQLYGIEPLDVGSERLVDI